MGFYRFHFFIFDQVLEIAKKFVTFDGQVNNLYVVPVNNNNGYDIDWKVMKTYKDIPPVMEPSLKVNYLLIPKQKMNN